MSSTTYYARHHGKTVGPVTPEQLNDLTRRGVIPMKAEIWEATIPSAVLGEMPEPTRIWPTLEKMGEQISIGFFRAIGAAPVLATAFGLVLVVLYFLLERMWVARFWDYMDHGLFGK